MDHTFIDKFRHALNTDVVSRLLVKYFVSKGYENFDRLIYPPFMQDLPQMIPELADKIEVIPHCQNIDPMSDSATLGWNLFVLGTQRQFLGETYHIGLPTLAMQLQQGRVIAENQLATRQTTPRRVLHFVESVLSRHKSGYVNLAPKIIPLPNQRQTYRPRAGANGMVSQFFTRSGYGT